MKVLYRKLVSLNKLTEDYLSRQLSPRCVDSIREPQCILKVPNNPGLSNERAKPNLALEDTKILKALDCVSECHPIDTPDFAQLALRWKPIPWFELVLNDERLDKFSNLLS